MTFKMLACSVTVLAFKHFHTSPKKYYMACAAAPRDVIDLTDTSNDETTVTDCEHKMEEAEVAVPAQEKTTTTASSIPMEAEAPKEATTSILTEVKAPEETKAAQVTMDSKSLEMQEWWPSHCKCGSTFTSKADVLSHLDQFDFRTSYTSGVRRYSVCSPEVVTFKDNFGVNPGYYVRRPRNVPEDYQSTNVKDDMKQCNCGKTFATTVEVLRHPAVYNGDGELLCSNSIRDFKAKYKVDPGYIVKGTHPTRIPKLPFVWQPTSNSIAWPKACNCGTRFTSEAEVLNHPRVIKNSECICSKTVLAFKKKVGGVDPGYYFWEESTPMRVCRADISIDGLRKCTCGCKFSSKLEILNHPYVYDRRGRLLCNKRINDFRRKTWAMPGIWIQNSPDDENLTAEVKAIFRDNPYTKRRIRPKKPVEPVQAEQEKPVEPVQAEQEKPVEPVQAEQKKSVEEWPSKCGCGATFASEAEVLAHLERFNETLESPSVCSNEVTAFKKKKGANPGVYIHRRNVPPKDVSCTHPILGMETCACGARFEDILDILRHPITYREEGKGRVLVCSENIVKFKGTRFSEVILPSSLPVVEVPREVETPKRKLEEETPKRKLEVEEEKWPSQCACNLNLTFPTLESALNHVEERIYPTGSLCSEAMNAFKTRNGGTTDFAFREYHTSILQPSTLKKPRQTPSPANETVGCANCSAHGFVTPAELANHMVVHETPLFECECRRHFTDRREAVNHTKVHSSGYNVMCEFTGCIKRFVNTGDLKNHILESHVRADNIEQQYHCEWPGCGSNFPKVKDAKEHMQERHIVSMNFVCACGQRLQTDRCVRQHLSNEYHGIKRHKCTWPACGKEFLSSVELRRHLMTHKKLEAPLQVDDDDSSSVSSSIFNRFKF